MRYDRKRQRQTGTFDSSASGEIDLTLFMSRRRLLRLSEEAKERLREIVRKDDIQKKFSYFHREGSRHCVSRTNFSPEEERWRIAMCAEVFRQIPGYCEWIPMAEEFIVGIKHRNSDPKYADVLWEPVRAIASNKMHYYTKLRQRMSENRPEWAFSSAFPDLSPASGGWKCLTRDGWAELQREMKLANEADYIKHILTKHEGEAKLAVDQGWITFHEDCHKPVFWHYQFARNLEVRRWLYNRSQEEWCDTYLTEREISWMLGKEDNETHLLRYNPRSASGESWSIRTGQYITLAEMFDLGQHLASCYDLYRAYLYMPTFIETRYHSKSNTASAQERCNAKILRHADTGRWGFPRR